MGNRLSKIITKTGDQGETGLGDGQRILKSSARIHVIGEFDELNCHIGILITHLNEDTMSLKEGLSWLQHKIFDAGGELAMPGYTFIQAEDVDYLDAWAEKMNQNLPPLTEFILPGGHHIVAEIHLSRAVTRRVERALIALKQTDLVNGSMVQFINRLSDVFFIMARYTAVLTNTPEVLWKNLNQKPK